jgi:hypothetical protein
MRSQFDIPEPPRRWDWTLEEVLPLFISEAYCIFKFLFQVLFGGGRFTKIIE